MQLFDNASSWPCEENSALVFEVPRDVMKYLYEGVSRTVRTNS